MNCDNLITYVFRPGDTLYNIAKHYGTTVENIISSNPHLNIYNLRVGEIITFCIDHVFPYDMTSQNTINANTVNSAKNMRTIPNRMNVNATMTANNPINLNRMDINAQMTPPMNPNEGTMGTTVTPPMNPNQGTMGITVTPPMNPNQGTMGTTVTPPMNPNEKTMGTTVTPPMNLNEKTMGITVTPPMNPNEKTMGITVTPPMNPNEKTMGTTVTPPINPNEKTMGTTMTSPMNPNQGTMETSPMNPNNWNMSDPMASPMYRNDWNMEAPMTSPMYRNDWNMEAPMTSPMRNDWNMEAPMPLNDMYAIPQEASDDYLITLQELDLSNDMRQAWTDHNLWTRMLVLSMIDGIKDSEINTKRLLKTPKDLADIFRKYYGNVVANNIEKVIINHHTICADLIKATKNKNCSVKDLNQRWYANADEMAKIFSSMNPYLEYNDMRNMFSQHLDLVKQQVENRINRNYDADAATFDNLIQQGLSMADIITNGIVNQFPDQLMA